jgi:hypothetical protein
MARLLESFRERRDSKHEKESLATRAEYMSLNTNEVRLARSEASLAAAQLDQMRFTIRAHAHWTHNRIPPLVESLIAAGGMMPPPDAETPVSKGDPLVLVGNPFEQTTG